jgi:hypothetical protein
MGWALTGAVINLPAIFIVLSMMTLLVIGIRNPPRQTALS